MLLLILSTWMNVDLITQVNELHPQSLGQWAGTLTMSVNGNDFFDASPDTPVYIRIRLDKGVRLAETLVDVESSPSRNEPISLAMSLQALDGSRLNAPRNTVRIVRWRRGEINIWLQVQFSSSDWIDQSGSYLPPDINRRVAWTIGRSIEEDQLVNEPLLAMGRANISSNFRGLKAVDTHIMVDSLNSFMDFELDRELNSDTIGFDFQTQFVRSAEFASEIQTGEAAVANFSGDDTLGIAADHGEYWLMPMDLQGFKTDIDVPNPSGQGRPISVEVFEDDGISIGSETITLKPGFNNLIGISAADAIRINESGGLHPTLVLTNGSNQRFSFPTIRAVRERSFILSVPVKLCLFNPNQQPAEITLHVLSEAGQPLSESKVQLGARMGSQMELPLLQPYQRLQVFSPDPVVAGAVEVSGSAWARALPSRMVDQVGKGGENNTWVSHIPAPSSKTLMTFTLVNRSRFPDRVTFTTFEQNGGQLDDVSIIVEPTSTMRISARELFDSSVSHARVASEACDLWWSYDPTLKNDQPLFEPTHGSHVRACLDWESVVTGYLGFAVINTSSEPSIVNLTVNNGFHDVLQTHLDFQPFEKKLLVESDFWAPGRVFITLGSDQTMAVLAAQRSASSTPQSFYPRELLDSQQAPLFPIQDDTLKRLIFEQIERYPLDGWISPGEAMSLSELECGHQGIQTLDGLEHFINLNSLKCNNNQIKRFDVLSQLTKLEYLDLSYNPAVRLPEFKRINRLKMLWLAGLNIQSLALQTLSHAFYLDVSENPIDLHSSSLPPHLKTLYLTACDLESVTLDHSELRYLELSTNRLQTLSLETPDLTYLYISDNRFEVMPDLSGLPALTRLIASNNALSDASFQHDRIEHLNLSYNELTDIQFLLDLPAIGSVNLEQNNLDIDQCNTIQTLKSRNVWIDYRSQSGYTLDCSN